MKTYSVTYNTYVGGVVDMTTKLVEAAGFVLETDYIFLRDDEEQVVLAVPLTRQPVVQVTK